MSNLEIFIEQQKKYKNTIVIMLVTAEVFKFIRVVEDEDDYYYEVRDFNGKYHYHSCCCGFAPLKGKIDEEDYKRLETLFTLNTDNSNTPSINLKSII